MKKLDPRHQEIIKEEPEELNLRLRREKEIRNHEIPFSRLPKRKLKKALDAHASDSPEEKRIAAERSVLLRKGMQETLLPNERKIVEWTLEGRTEAEVQHLMHRSPDSIRIQLAKARKKLKNFFAKAYEKEIPLKIIL